MNYAETGFREGQVGALEASRAQVKWGPQPHPCCCRTLVTGAVGSLLLDWYGWPSVFYFSGGLTLLWVWYVYKCLLSERGACAAGEGEGLAPVPSTRQPQSRPGRPGLGFAF